MGVALSVWRLKQSVEHCSEALPCELCACYSMGTIIYTYTHIISRVDMIARGGVLFKGVANPFLGGVAIMLSY